jgi:outer membrane protein TolC
MSRSAPAQVLLLALLLARPAAADDIAWVIAAALGDSPALEFAATEVHSAEGQREDAAGAFEPQWVASLSYNYGRGELLPTQVRAEEGRRFLFEQIDSRFRNLAANLQAELDAGPGPVSLDCEGNIILINGREICDPPDAAAERARFEALVEALQRDASDPAVAAALRELQQQNTFDNRSNIEQIIRDSEQIAASARQSRAELGVMPEVEIRQQIEGLLSWQRRFENGLGVVPSIGFDGVVSNFESKVRSPRYGGQGLLPAYRAGVGLTFILPLGRGGGLALRTPRDAAVVAVDAARSDYAATRSLSVYTALQAYIGLAAAQAQRALAKRRAERAEALLGSLRELARGDLLSRAELAQSEAQAVAEAAAILQADAAVLGAERSLRQRLGLAADALLPRPGASDLEQLAALPRCDGSTSEWQARAERTPDFDSLRSREQQAGLMLVAAQDGVRPRLDLSLTFAYSARSESAKLWRGLGEAFDDTLRGPSVLLSLDGDLELRRRRAGGQIEQALALQTQARLGLEQRRRSEFHALRQLAETLAQASAELALRRRAAQDYQRATEGAEARLRAGEGSLLEVLNSRSLADSAAAQALASAETQARQLLELRWRLGGLQAPAGAGRAWLLESSCGELDMFSDRAATATARSTPSSPTGNASAGRGHDDAIDRHPQAVSAEAAAADLSALEFATAADAPFAFSSNAAAQADPAAAIDGPVAVAQAISAKAAAADLSALEFAVGADAPFALSSNAPILSGSLAHGDPR